MDRRLLYKSTLKNDALENRRNIANKQRSDNRSKAFSNTRKLSNHENSSNILQQQLSDKQNQIITSSNILTISNENKIHDKKLPYIERYRLWKKEKENRLKEEREKKKIQKPFISTVRPTDKNDVLFKLPQPPKLLRTENKVKNQIQNKITTEKNHNVNVIKKLPQQQQNQERKNTAIIKPFSRIQQKQQQQNPTTKIKLQPSPLPSSSSQNPNNCTLMNDNASGFENNLSSFITTNQTNHDFLTSTSRKLKENPTNNATFILSGDENISPIEPEPDNIFKKNNESVKKVNHQNNVDNKKNNVAVKELKINNKRNKLSKNLKHKIQKPKQPSDYLVQLLKKAKNDYNASKVNEINDLINIKPETNQSNQLKTIQQQQKEEQQQQIDVSLRRSSRLLSNNKKTNIENKNTISTPVIKRNSLLTPKLSTSKQTRLQKIVQQQQRSRSNTPQRQKQQQKEKEENFKKSINTKITKTPTRQNKNFSFHKEQEQFNESTTTPTTSNKNRTIQKQQNHDDIDELGKNENDDKQMNKIPKVTIVENESNKNSSLTNQNDFNTPPSSKINLNNSFSDSKSSNYLSPFVTVSRGKVSARKEKEKRNSLYKLELSQSLSPATAIENTLEIRRIKEAIKYFRQLLRNENERLTECCNKWELYKNENNDKNDNCNDMINATIGQTRLLLNKKMKQFYELINKCEQCIPQAAKYYKNESTTTTTTTTDTTTSEQQLILTEDLEGFWSMVCLQIDNIDKRFENLEKWKSNNWNDPDEIEQIKKKQNIKAKKQTNKSTKATNVIREMIKKAQAEHAKKRNDNNLNNDDVIFVPTSTKPLKTSNQLTPLKTSNQLTPLRRSARLSNKKEISIITISSPSSSCSSTSTTSTRYSTSKQTRLQKIAQKQRSRSSNTPQQQQQQQLEELTEKLTIKTPAKDTINVTSVQKSCLKQPNSKIVKNSVKRSVAFSKQLATITFQPSSIDNQEVDHHDMSGIDILNVSDC